MTGSSAAAPSKAASSGGISGTRPYKLGALHPLGMRSTSGRPVPYLPQVTGSSKLAATKKTPNSVDSPTCRMKQGIHTEDLETRASTEIRLASCGEILRIGLQTFAHHGGSLGVLDLVVEEGPMAVCNLVRDLGELESLLHPSSQ
jgi:hypothetical protein